MSNVWLAALGRHAAAVIIGALVGALYGRPLAGIFIAILGLLIWHLFNLFQLERWMETGNLSEMPAGNGVWARVFARAKYLDQRSSANRKKFRRLVKELRASTKAFPDGGILLNENREIVTYNKAARQLLQLKRKRDRGQRIDNFIRHPAFVAYLDESERGVQEALEIPAPIGGKWLSCRLMPYGPGQSLLFITDITHAKKLEAMRTDFVANASHELRSPLTVITGYLDAMGHDEECPEVWAAPISDMREQAQRMSRLVSDLLQLSQLESASPTPLDKTVDIAAMLTSSKKEILAHSQHTGDVELALSSNARLLGEEAEIQSVVSNLLSNAVRYSPDEGRIRISWDVDDSGGHLSVADAGIGISAEDIPRLTERFYRTDAGRARQQGGTGLGLAIVKYALKRHDADLEVISELGQGSRFICHFSPERISSQS
ncbi:MAG: phosphate regulon sensor histidine kinase PhoR [Gammaproteobacteria bacterium]|nr:phosphate regulon sensor histidine kinase PhoR [Gammaproteobacteria bacterium]